MKSAWITRVVSVVAVLALVGAASAETVPGGLTGLWRFQTSADKLKATIGVDLTSSHADNSGWFSGPWTVIEPGLSDGGVVQERSWDYLTVNPSFAPNGGGSYVNEYTVLMDYVQTSGTGGWNSLFQTSFGGNDSDGDLWTDGSGHIGVGAVGYSTQAYDTAQWHRIVLSVDNGNFFRVYVDGALFLDGAGQSVDGRFSLYPDRFNLFADDSWEDAWGLVSTVATWNSALTTADIAAMGGTGTPITVPEPATMSLLALAGLACWRRRRA